MNEKYKMFRQFMVNELGITREDIKEWTFDAVETTVKKEFGQINITGIINKILDDELNAGYPNLKEKLINKAAKELADSMAQSMRITVGDKFRAVGI